MALTSVGVREVTRRPAFVRWLGFAGSVLLGSAAFVRGAFIALGFDVTPISIARGPNGALIYVLWAFGIAGLVTAWWLGRHLVGTGILSPRWVVVTVALWMLPMLVCPLTGSRDVYAYACQGALVAAGHSPYQEGVSALPCQWLDSVSIIWRDTPAPYGPLFLTIAGAIAKTGSLPVIIVVYRLLAVAGVITIAACLPPLARHVGVPVDRALWLLLACPLVVFHVVGGAHNDGLTIGLALAGFAVLATRSHRPGGLILGGLLLGLSISLKPSMGVVLPFAALFAAGGPLLLGTGVLIRRGIAVMGTALATLLALAAGSGLGTLGWITALSHAGDSVAWTSPPTGVGLTVGYLERIFGAHWDAVPTCRLIALVLMPIVLLVILWHSRNHNPLYGAGLALLATIFLSPVVQPWYLVWPLAMFAVTRARVRWLLIAISIASCIVLPDGSGFTKVVQAPMSFVMTGVVIWTIVRGFSWLRGYEPNEIEYSPAALAGPDGIAIEPIAPASPASPAASVRTGAPDRQPTGWPEGS
jgi:hypothetical protein